MTVYVLALVIGVVAGLRTLTAPAAISWAAYLGWQHLSGTWLAFLGYAWTPWIFTIPGLVELITDQLPSTPSRTVPPQFGARLVLGRPVRGGNRRGRWIAGRRRSLRCCRRCHRHARRANHPGQARDDLWQRSSCGHYRGCGRDWHRRRDRAGAEMSRPFDAIIIGAGQAGPRATASAE
jgi:hypothetical protein